MFCRHADVDAEVFQAIPCLLCNMPVFMTNMLHFMSTACVYLEQEASCSLP